MNLRPAADRALRWPRVVPAGWFVLTVVGSGLILYVQIVLGGAQVPVQSLARVGLVGVAIGCWAFAVREKDFLDPRLRAPLVAFVVVTAASLLYSAFRSQALGDALGEFGFMYSIGIFLSLYLLIPVVARFGQGFRLFCASAVAFGFLQAMRQDLFLPQSFLERFGIVFQTFVNERVRVLGFFASPPRFAELLVLVCALLQHSLITGKRRWLTMSAYLVTLWVLYNTFSRSGYVLFLSTLAIQLILMRRQFFGSDSGAVARFYALIAGAGAGLALLVAGRFPLDSSVTDTTSFAARQGHWSSLIDQLRGLGAFEVVLGTGTAARYSFLSSEYFVVDNVVLAMFLYGGVLGVLTFLWLFIRIFSVAAVTAPRDRSRWDALLAFYVSLLVEGMFVDNHNTIFIVQFALLGMLAHDRILRVHAPTATRTASARSRLSATGSATLNSTPRERQ